MAEAGAPALAPSEPITTVSDGRALSAGGRSHRGSDPTSAASAHHPRMVEPEAPPPAPSEPIIAVSDGRALSTDGRSRQGSDPTPAADPHRGARAGDDSTSHFSATAPPAADDAIATAASAAPTLTAPPSPDVTVGTADGTMATAASAAGIGMDVDTDAVPAATAPPTAGHISSCLLRIRRRAAEMAVDPALGAAAPAGASQAPPPAKKRQRSRGPAQATRHAAFLASRQQDAADGAQVQVETDARGDGGGGLMTVSRTTPPRRRPECTCSWAVPQVDAAGRALGERVAVAVLFAL